MPQVKTACAVPCGHAAACNIGCACRAVAACHHERGRPPTGSRSRRDRAPRNHRMPGAYQPAVEATAERAPAMPSRMVRIHPMLSPAGLEEACKDADHGSDQDDVQPRTAAEHCMVSSGLTGTGRRLAGGCPARRACQASRGGLIHAAWRAGSPVATRAVAPSRPERRVSRWSRRAGWPHSARRSPAPRRR